MRETHRRILDALVGDAEIAAHFSDEADIRALLAFETALAATGAESGMLPEPAAEAIAAACASFEPDWNALAAGMAKDGVVVPTFVAALRAIVPEPHGQWLHWGATSQDAVDTSLVLRLGAVLAELSARLDKVTATLERLKAREGHVALMAVTRMQHALPFRASDRIDGWLQPLERHKDRLAQLRPRLLVVQLGGAVSNRVAFQERGDEVGAAVALRLGLRPAQPWHSARDRIAELGGWLSMLTGALGKIGEDVALMAQNEIGAVRLAGGGGSSAMAHKVNPVAAEVLVALARYNAGSVGTLHQALVHENERSGAAWTLEWLVLPQMAITAGAALANTLRMLDGMHFQDMNERQ